MSRPPEDGPEIEQRNGYTAAKFLGQFSVREFQRQADAASKACRDQGTGRLLVDTTCFDVSPTTVERYELACHAVKISTGLNVALVVAPAFIDPNKFGIVVARNRGLVVEAFTDPRKALEWLLAQGSGGSGAPPTS
jgi:hypothetical protein